LIGKYLFQVIKIAKIQNYNDSIWDSKAYFIYQCIQYFIKRPI